MEHASTAGAHSAESCKKNGPKNGPGERRRRVAHLVARSGKSPGTRTKPSRPQEEHEERSPPALGPTQLPASDLWTVPN